MRHHDGVAIRRRLGGETCSDHAGCAAAIVDHDLLTETGGELVGDDACDGVDPATRRERHDQGDRAAGIALVRRHRGEQ